MNALAHLISRIETHAAAFNRPGVIAVRLGYRVRDDWLPSEAAIVVIVDSAGAPAGLPTQVDGIPVDVRKATPVDQLQSSVSQPQEA